MSTWSEKYVLICPGFLVKLNSLKNSQELTNEIFFVLAHELTHHIDSRKFPKSYQKLADCYQKEIAQSLNKKDGSKCPKDDSECIKDHQNRIDKTTEKCNKDKDPIHAKACEF